MKQVVSYTPQGKRVIGRPEGGGMNEDGTDRKPKPLSEEEDKDFSFYQHEINVVLISTVFSN